MSTTTVSTEERGNGASLPPAFEELPNSPAAVSPDSFPAIAAIVRQPTGGVTAQTAGPVPTRNPGQVAAGIGESLGRITHLWSYDAPGGAWVFLDGIGWKRLCPASSHGHSQLTLLATIATHANIPVYYNLNAAGQIDRLYV